MPRWLSSAPRKKLPPPTTMATWVPEATTSATCRAMDWTTSGSTPTLPPPKTSPESLSSTRRYESGDERAASPSSVIWRLLSSFVSLNPSWFGPSALAHLEVSELRDRDARGDQHVLHRLLLLVHRLLLEQDDRLEEAV